MPSSHLILCHPLLLLPPIPPSTRVFSNESTLRMKWPKYWSFSFSIIPSKEIPGQLGLYKFRSSFRSNQKPFLLFKQLFNTWGFPGGSDGKESACNAGDPSSKPGLRRSPREGNSYPLQYSCLENPMDRRDSL